MALPSTPPISMSQVKAELGISGTLNLTDPRVRSLFSISSGTINLLAGLNKSNYIRPTTYTSNFTITNPTYAYDTTATTLDSSTCATIVNASDTATTVTFMGFSGTAAKIGSVYINISGSFADDGQISSTFPGTIYIQYSTDGGGTFSGPLGAFAYPISQTSFVFNLRSDGESISCAPNLLQIRFIVQGYSYGNRSLGNFQEVRVTLNVYDILCYS